MKNITLLLNIVFFLCLFSVEGISCEHVELELRLKGKKYSSLVLSTLYRTHEGWDVLKEFHGHSKNGYVWNFIIPDSVNKVSDGYAIRIYPFNFEKNQGRAIEFTLKELPITQTGRFITLEEQKTIIEGSYKGEAKKTFDGLTYLFPDTAVESPTIICDIFDFIPNKKKRDKYTALELALFYPDFSIMPRDSSSYEGALHKRINLVKEYPDSKYLFSQFIYSVNYKNKEDLKLVFDNFSEKLKKSYLGERIEKDLLEKISLVDIFTVKLANTTTGENESVIENYSKPTLVIFSASWCAPCHRLIPLLKEIYKEYETSINMVYISMDKEDRLENWKDLMKKEQIPWRSLWAGNNAESLYQSYLIAGIPHGMFLYKDKIEQVNAWNSTELRQTIMEIVNRK